jgi:hypothetical protein
MVERSARTGLVVRRKDARASLRPSRPARQPKPTRRQTVLYGIVIYAVARLPWDRRFQEGVITLAIALAAAKSILQEGAVQSFKGVSALTERNYLRNELEHLHRPAD